MDNTFYSSMKFFALMVVLLLYVYIRLSRYNPLTRPKGLVLLVVMTTQAIDKVVSEKTNSKVSRFLTPCLMLLITYLIVRLLVYIGVHYLEFPHYVGLVLCILITNLISCIKNRKKGE